MEPQGALSRVFLRDGARPRDLMQQIQQRGLVVEHFEVVGLRWRRFSSDGRRRDGSRSGPRRRGHGGAA